MANDTLLWQRRIDQAHDRFADTTGAMPAMSMAFRPDAAAAAAAASMPLLQRPPQQFYSGNVSSMPSNGLIDPYAVHNTFSYPPTTFEQSTYTQPSAFAGASFGSLSWPAAPFSHIPTSTVPPAFNQADSQSSSDSETYIKTEEDWPIQTYQLFDDTDIFDSPKLGSPAAESADESKPSVFSTDIDTLMRTIQCKSGSRPQPNDEPLEDDEAPAAKRAKRRYICDVAGCGKAFYQKTHLDIHKVRCPTVILSRSASFDRGSMLTVCL